MAYPPSMYLLMGFVIGFGAGIFTAYKLAQNAKLKQERMPERPVRQYPESQVTREVEPNQIIWQKKK